jgi:16S rRNA (guanine966-N2)-methyltransferase
MFSSLGAWVEDAGVLDLYAGTGALGIEALSRGARHAVLVERDRAAARMIRDNLERARLTGRATVVASDVLTFLRRGASSHGPSDLVLLDPPYATAIDEVEAVVAALGLGWLSEAGWRVVLTRSARNPNLVIPVDWRPTRRLPYGDTLIQIFAEA